MVTAPSAEFLALQAALAGEYSLQRELGRGGMGVVYLARDVQLDRDVAIKVLPAQLALDAAARERFIREARTAAGLSHPNIVPIHRVSEVGGFVFFVMSYVEGETLGERIRARGPLPPAEASRLMREVSWALAYAHGRGIVHRDVKPDNILLEAGTGRAMVTDFGIAHRGESHESEKIMGTAHFMSPEQAAGRSLDGRSDIYALGVVGYLAVSGRLPFETPNLPALLVRQSTEAAPSVMTAAPGLPPALAAAIDRCLERDPEGRFANGEALGEALAPATDSRPALPPTLRAWLAAKNPLLLPYLAWSTILTVMTAGNSYAVATHNPGSKIWDPIILGIAALSPLVPIIGFHLIQARRQFRVGHTLADLRAALEVARRECAETEASVRDEVEPQGHRLLRLATTAATTWLGVTMALVMSGVVRDRDLGPIMFIAPFLSTLVFGAASNALGVTFIPKGIRDAWQAGIRDRLWNSRAGVWLAKRLGAPERSQLAGASAFRATEAALGVAAAELFAALPKEYREQLADLPATVEALEARAAEARAEIELLAVMAPSATTSADVLAGRKKKAQSHLSESVAALEGIRLDLLRLHASAGDLAPLTTLMDAVREIGEQANRLAEAQREVDGVATRSRGAKRIPTPA